MGFFAAAGGAIMPRGNRLGECAIETGRPTAYRLFAEHPRHWRDHLYVYPVISRRSKGLSIGVNLNPDLACNFDCIYCQVDRTAAPRVRRVDPGVLANELDHVVALAAAGALFDDPQFAATPQVLRRINDIAFSGDGEPTTCPIFAECVRIAAGTKQRYGLDRAKIVLITDACYLTRPQVAAGLEIMDEHQGEVWAKLDAGTEEYYRQVNRPNYPLRHVLDNIVAAARVRAVCIQSLWMRIAGQAPPDEEVDAFAERINEMVRAGASFGLVQIYTVARRPAQDCVSALDEAELTAIAHRVAARSSVAVETFPANG
jgi:wyosine [tRNA(Phe)-imidazoG37] synthetase (radical SAM superfamily)